MRSLWGIAGACALIVFGVGVWPAHAGEPAQVQLCCDGCGQPAAVSAYAPAPCSPPACTTFYVQRSYYTPVTCCAPPDCPAPCHCRRCGPIRRLLGRLGLCRSCSCKPVCPPPACAPAPVLLPGPVAPPPACVPAPRVVTPELPPTGSPQPVPGVNESSSGVDRGAPQVPPEPVPAISGSSYRPAPRLTPPLPPPPVRLDRVTSYQRDNPG